MCALPISIGGMPSPLRTAWTALVSEALKEDPARVLLKPCPVENLLSLIENEHERKGFTTEVAEKSQNRFYHRSP